MVNKIYLVLTDLKISRCVHVKELANIKTIYSLSEHILPLYSREII
jgi:hypothetical protein